MKTSHTIAVSGMQCSGCEDIIKDSLASLPGVLDSKAHYPSGKVRVVYDSAKTSLADIQHRITAKGYTVNRHKPSKNRQWFLKFSFSFFALTLLIALMVWSRQLWRQFSLPQIDSNTGNGMIFVVGLITGLHCIGMCGNFVLNYTVKDAEQGRSPYWSHVLYGTGKTLSYALFGALFGFLGSLFKITPLISGVTAIIAGLFLLAFGMNMLNAFSVLKYVRIKQPEAIAKFAVNRRKQSKSPFFIGFFSGFLLGCGPLQAMYVLAAGQGDPLQGAKFLTLFGLGTLPALIGFGMLARVLSGKMTRRFVQASGLILIVMGLMMVNKGLVRTKSGYDFKSIQQSLSLKTIVNLDGSGGKQDSVDCH